MALADDDHHNDSTSFLWEMLPDDLWEEIFKNLDGRHWGGALKSISLVCKRFLPISNRARKYVFIKDRGKGNGKGNNIRLEPCFYSRFSNIKTIDFWCRDRNLDATITHLAHSFLPLESLLFYEQSRFPTEAMRLLGQRMTKTLRSLCCSYFDAMTDGDLAVVAECFSYLHKFEVRGSAGQKYDKITDKGIWEISTKLKSLVSIDISQQPCVSHQSLMYLASNCSSLRELHTGVIGHYKSIICMDQVDQVKFFLSLTSLELFGLKISDLLLLQLSELSLKLRELKLFSPQFTGHINWSLFCGFLKSCRSLSLLDLISFPSPMHTDAVEFATSIPNIRSLQLDADLWHVLPPKILLYLFKYCLLLDSICVSNCYSRREEIDAPSECVGGALDWKKAALAPCLIGSLKLYYCDDLCDETLKIIVSICPKLHSLSIVDCSKITKQEIEAATKSFNNIKYLHVD